MDTCGWMGTLYMSVLEQREQGQRRSEDEPGARGPGCKSWVHYPDSLPQLLHL